MRRKPPPEATRFKPGQSGNPRGRPRKRGAGSARSAFDILEGKTFSFQIRDRTEELSVEEALQQKIYQQAIAGSQRARREVLEMMKARENALRRRRPPPASPIELFGEALDPDSATEALLLLGVAAADGTRRDHGHAPYLRLEPWAVQMAIERRALPAFDADDVELVKRSTRDPQTLVWPQRFRSRGARRPRSAIAGRRNRRVSRKAGAATCECRV